MFLEIEGNQLINLLTISRIELFPREDQKFARLYYGSVILAESHLAFQYLTDPRNRTALFGPEPEPAGTPEPGQEVIAR